MGQVKTFLYAVVTISSTTVLLLHGTGRLKAVLKTEPSACTFLGSLAGFLVGGALWLKAYMRGGWYYGEERIPGKTVIITGGNTGIGKETAGVLAQRGARIILACRDKTRGETAVKELIEDTGSTNIVFKKLDLSSLASVHAFADHINKTEPRVDILINNAGIMMCPKQLTEDGIEAQIGVNHIGHFLLTNLLLDKLKACAPSRIIIVSSMAHTMGSINLDDLNSEKSYGNRAAYYQSKVANLLHMRELAKRLEGTNVTVNSLHPGMVRTELQKYIFIRHAIFSPLLNIMYKTPIEGAQTQLRLALDPTLETVSGKYFSDCEEKMPSRLAQDDAAAKRLWEISEHWTRKYSQ